ncbi:malate synthase [Streptomyces noursei]|uniref:Malate synthase n=1 Tax=Streptomyces noursei TaxID=1971 RepID=A0A401QRF3_STRNR|nr:malate synthase [Streptomyces noursei]
MEEILYELREHSAGLNAGRWDYLFSMIKTFGHRTDFLLPDRAKVTMTAPSCGPTPNCSCAPATGAERTPSAAWRAGAEQGPAVNEAALAKVRLDKERETEDGFDGSWVAHPASSPCAARSSTASWATAPTNSTAPATTST